VSRTQDGATIVWHPVLNDLAMIVTPFRTGRWPWDWGWQIELIGYEDKHLVHETMKIHSVLRLRRRFLTLMDKVIAGDEAAAERLASMLYSSAVHTGDEHGKETIPD
jgi:hypothetical protein